MSSSTPRPCAACKCMKRKCTDDCVFAPYFPPDQQKKFADVHSVFGASNVAKLLNDLHPSQRKHAANSLVYEAESRLQDPIYGCVGQVAVLQCMLQQVQADIINGKKELTTYIGPQAMLPINSQPHGFIPQQQVHPGNPSSSAAVLPAGAPTQGCQLEIREPQIQSQPQQQIFEAAVAQATRQQQEILRAYELAVREQHELLRTYNELLQQSKPVSFNGGFDPTVAGGSNQLFEGQQLAAKEEQQEILRAYELAIKEKQKILRTYELLLQSKPVSFNGGFDPAVVGGSSLHHEHQSFQAQQLAVAVAAREQQEILQTYEQQRQEQLVGFNRGIHPAAAGNSITASKFYQTNIGGGGGVMPPSLAPGTFGKPYQIEPQQWEHHGHPPQTQLQQLQQQDQQTRQAQSESEKGKDVAH